MAKTQQQRSAASDAKAKAAGQEELRHYVRPGTRAMLAELMAWNGVTVISEAVQYLIMNAHALGPDGSAAALAPPRHDFALPENVARELFEQGRRTAARLDSIEQ